MPCGGGPVEDAAAADIICKYKQSYAKMKQPLHIAGLLTTLLPRLCLPLESGPEDKNLLKIDKPVGVFGYDS